MRWDALLRIVLVCAFLVGPGLVRARAEQSAGDPPAEPREVSADLKGFVLGKGAWTLQDPQGVCSESLGMAQAEGRLSIHGNLFLTGALRFRTEANLQPQRQTDVELRRAELTYRAPWWQMTVGRQQVVWGKADGLRLLDIVNPLDLREFILDDYSRSRIPLWMINGELFRGTNAIQVLVIPEERGDRLPDPGGRFAEDLPLPLPPAVAVPPAERPDMGNPGNWEYGLRWESRLRSASYTVNAFRTWSDQPVWFASIASDGPILQRRFVRQNVVGGSWDMPVGATVIRGELTFTPNGYSRTLLDDGSVSFVERSVADTVVGVDWISGRWTVSPQLFYLRTLGSAAGLLDDRQRTLATLLIHVNAWQDRVVFQTFGAFGANDHDRWLSPKVTYDAGKGIEVTLGADLFGGPPTSPLGRFDEQSRLVMQILWQFDRGKARTPSRAEKGWRR